MTNTTAALLGIAMLVAVALVSTLDRASASNNHDLYCEMTALYTESNGQHGWPSYKEGVTCP